MSEAFMRLEAALPDYMLVNQQEDGVIEIGRYVWIDNTKRLYAITLTHDLLNVLTVDEVVSSVSNQFGRFCADNGAVPYTPSSTSEWGE